MKGSGSKRVANRLVAMGSAAVLTVYAAGFIRTRAAAQKLAGADQRRVAPAPAEAGGTSAPPFIEPPSVAGRTASPQAASSTDGNIARAVTSPAPKRAAKASSTAVSTKTPAAAPGTTTVDPAPVATAAPAAANLSTTATAAVPATVPPAGGADSRTVDPPPPPKPASLYKDGTYSGWGTSRHGDIQAAVVIEDGRIVSAYISQCLTRYSCSWIAHLPPQIVSRQSPECDYVSGATQSTNAFYYAIVEALSKAK